jgi:hypothetical protein
LQAKRTSGGSWTTVTTSPAGKGTVTFKVAPVRNTSYQVILKWSHSSLTSKAVCVRVTAKLTLCVKPGMYGGGVAISGTLVPGWTGGKVCIRIAKVVHCNRTMQVAKLTVSLTQGPGDSSAYATTWTGASGNATYVFTASVASTADFAGTCVCKAVKL